jgi:hypothetical protein
MSYHIGPNTKLEQGVVGGQPSRSFKEVNISFEQGKHRMHNPFIGFTLIFTLCYVFTFTCRSWMETRCIMVFPYKNTLLPCDGLEW